MKKIEQLSLSSIVESISPTHLSLINVIDRIEKDRLLKINELQTLKIGQKVKCRDKTGLVVEVSAKFTSVVVDFDGRKQRFFMNKRKGVRTINELKK